MMLLLNRDLIQDYNSGSQQIRVLSEDWVQKKLPCPLCGDRLIPFQANFVGIDFFCNACDAHFQLKSLKRKMKKRIPGGEYRKTFDALQSGDAPNLLLLIYDPATLGVLSVYLVKKEFITTDLLLARKPLKSTARRAGWQGCYWLIERIPADQFLKII